MGAAMRFGLKTGIEFEKRSQVMAPLLLFVFVATTLLWGFLYLIGYRIRTRVRWNRKTTLKEFFALSGVLCFLLVLCRDAFELAEFSSYLTANTWRKILQPELGVLCLVVFLQFQFRWYVTVVTNVAITAAFCTRHMYHEVTLPSLLTAINFVFLEIATDPFFLVVIACCRLCGFSLHWTGPMGLWEQATKDPSLPSLEQPT